MLKDFLEFEKSEERKAISDDYSNMVALLDHEYAWQTMLYRCRLLAETYRT